MHRAHPMRLRQRPALRIGDRDHRHRRERVEHRLVLGQIEPAVQRGDERRRLPARTARTDNSRDGNAGNRIRRRAGTPARASPCAARSDRAPSRRAAARAATSLRASPRSPNRRSRTASRRGRARSVPPSARRRRARCRHRASAERLRSTARFERYASNMPFVSIVKFRHPATTDNAQQAKYLHSWRELNFRAASGTFAVAAASESSTGARSDRRHSARTVSASATVRQVRANAAEQDGCRCSFRVARASANLATGVAETVTRMAELCGYATRPLAFIVPLHPAAAPRLRMRAILIAVLGAVDLLGRHAIRREIPGRHAVAAGRAAAPASGSPSRCSAR